jgi:hypothetical protein
LPVKILGLMLWLGIFNTKLAKNTKGRALGEFYPQISADERRCGGLWGDLTRTTKGDKVLGVGSGGG